MPLTGNFQVVQRILQFICENGQHEKELFKSGGDEEKARTLKKSLVEGRGMTVQLSEYDVPTIARALKQYLADIDPLFTWEKFDTFIAIEKQADSAGRASALTAAVDALPPQNKAILQILFALFTIIVYNKDTTGMSAGLLSYSFAPSLLRHRDLMTSMKSTKAVNALLEIMITHAQQIFSFSLARPASASVAPPSVHLSSPPPNSLFNKPPPSPAAAAPPQPPPPAVSHRISSVAFHYGASVRYCSYVSVMIVCMVF